MINKLRTRLILLILGGTILSIALVSFITNINVLKNFDSYMLKEQDSRFEVVAELIQNSYDRRQGWTDKAFVDIKTSSLINNFDIEVRDNNSNVIFSSYMQNAMVNHHHNMMNRMGHGMMRKKNHMMRNNFTSIENYAEEENYITQKRDLIYNNEKVGSLLAGHIGPYLISEKDVAFAKDINSSIFFAAIISIITAIILGIYSSKIFVNPILQITDAANSIRKGKLGTNIDLDNRIIELQDLSQSINHLSKSLKQAELLRARLTADISHELRTPLTILQSHIEAISDGVWEASPDKLNICKNEVLRLIKLVEELKYLTDIENHNLDLKFEKYSLSSDIRDISHSFLPQFNEKNIEFNAHIKNEVIITADRDRIKQVFINLLSNALEFTPGGGKVDIELFKETPAIRCIIKDSGIGIEDKDIPYIFERLYKADLSRNRKIGGRGIGLSIAKTVVESHGGTIHVESKKGQGSIFIVELPENL